MLELLVMTMILLAYKETYSFIRCSLVSSRKNNKTRFKIRKGVVQWSQILLTNPDSWAPWWRNLLILQILTNGPNITNSFKYQKSTTSDCDNDMNSKNWICEHFTTPFLNPNRKLYCRRETLPKFVAENISIRNRKLGKNTQFGMEWNPKSSIRCPVQHNFSSIWKSYS